MNQLIKYLLDRLEFCFEGEATVDTFRNSSSKTAAATRQLLAAIEEQGIGDMLICMISRG